jgi:hypothetical protein
MFQLLGVAAIVDAAITIVIPILHRLSRDEISGAMELPHGTTAAAAPAASRVAEIDGEIARLRQRIAELERLKGQV